MQSDFIIRYDPKTETQQDILKKIIKSLFINRLSIRKPVICFIGGDSGEAKSSTAVKLMQIILSLQGQDIREYMTKEDDVLNVYTPIQYPQKLQKILNEKKYKHINCIAIHESRDIIKAKMWHTFVATAIADVNAQIRQIKPLAIFIVSQFIRDITAEIRYTLTYYMTCYRNMDGRSATLHFYRMYKDDRDLENPKLKKRSFRGIIVYPDGTRRPYIFNNLRFTPPPKDLQDIFDTNDLAAKEKIIKGRLERLIKEMSLELQVGNPKIDAMIKYYSENPDSLRMIGRKAHKKWKLKPEVVQMHDLNTTEFKEFEKGLNEALKNAQFKVTEKLEYAESTQDV